MIDRSKLHNKRQQKKQKKETKDEINVSSKQIMIDLVNISHVLMCNSCSVKPFCNIRKRCSNELPISVRIQYISEKYPDKANDMRFISEEIPKVTEDDIKKYFEDKHKKLSIPEQKGNDIVLDEDQRENHDME